MSSFYRGFSVQQMLNALKKYSESVCLEMVGDDWRLSVFSVRHGEYENTGALFTIVMEAFKPICEQAINDREALALSVLPDDKVLDALMGLSSGKSPNNDTEELPMSPLDTALEYINNIPLHSSEPHVLHFVDQARQHIESSKVRRSFIGSSVGVRTPIEYGVMLGAYLTIGAELWPWHKGYKPLEDDQEFYTYAWEDCGILKQAGVLESSQPTYSTPLDLIKAIRGGEGSE